MKQFLCLMLAACLLAAMAPTVTAEDAATADGGAEVLFTVPVDEEVPEVEDVEIWTDEIAKDVEAFESRLAKTEDEIRYDNVCYRIDDSDQRRLTISGCTENAKEIWIYQSFTYKGLKWYVTAMDSYAFANQTTLKKVHFIEPEDGVIYLKGYGVGLSAFQNCTGLNMVDIPASFRQLEGDPYWQNAFYECWIDNNIEYEMALDDDGLIGVRLLTYSGPESGEVAIPLKSNGYYVRWLADDAFRGKKIDGILFPDGVITIGDSCFEGTNITSAILPGVSQIGEKAFYNCPKLSLVNLMGPVGKMGSAAFANCPSLSTLFIGNNVKRLGTEAFYGALALESVTISNSVEAISDRAFGNCTALAEVAFGSSLKTIGDMAFTGTGLKDDVVIPDSVTYMGQKAFADCKSLRRAALGSGLGMVCNGMFGGCSALEEVTIKSGPTAIGEGALENCSALLRLEIPASVTTIQTQREFNPDVLVVCDAGTYAQEWAIENGLAYDIGSGPVAPPAPEPVSISDCEIAAIAAKTYTGKAIRPAPAVSYNGVSLVKGTDYKLSYANNVNAGTATVTVKGIGDYTGSAKVMFAINPRKISQAKITGVGDKTYTGSAIKLALVLKYGGNRLAADADYTVSYKNNRKIGTATVTVRGIGNFRGSVGKTFRINPKPVAVSKLTAGTKRLTITWEKAAGGAGYQIQYGLKKEYKTATPVTITRNKTVKKVIKGLKSKKTYYVRVRAYRKVGGVEYVSKWSKVKKIKVK